MINKKIITVLMVIVIFCSSLVNVYGNDGIGMYYHDLGECVATSKNEVENKAKNEFGCDNCTVTEIWTSRYFYRQICCTMQRTQRL